MILGADGKPAVIPPRQVPPCPECGRNGERLTTKSFGGYWRINCQCGYEFDKGRGVPPIQEV